jgi:Raf kinase inhibitor-like YbhB/YbcL family protein
MSLTLASSAYDDNGNIPVVHTCDGGDVSPPLSWSNVPNGTKSLTLIIEDPDAPDPAAPQRTFTHWVLYNISPDAQGLPQGVPPGQLPSGTREGQNDWERTGYGGPCPPVGCHRYFHKLFALDVELSGLEKPTRNELEKAMEGHIIEQAKLIGLYQRKK